MTKAEFREADRKATEVLSGRTPRRGLTLVGLLVTRDEDAAVSVRRVLEEFNSLILLRNGIPYGNRGAGIMSVILKATPGELGDLTERLEGIRGVRIRTVML